MTSVLSCGGDSAGPAPARGPPASAGATHPKSKASGYKHDPLGFYTEPVRCSALLFEAIRFKQAVYDPCCGIYTIPKVAASFGLRASGSDIVARSPHQQGCRDFLEDKEVEQYQPPNIVCNPPYKLAEAFARKAIAVAYQKTAILVRLDFLASQKRHALFTEHPPAWVLVLSQRPSMPPGDSDIPAKGGMNDYGWIIWDAERPGAPTEMRWLK